MLTKGLSSVSFLCMFCVGRLSDSRLQCTHSSIVIILRMCANVYGLFACLVYCHTKSFWPKRIMNEDIYCHASSEWCTAWKEIDETRLGRSQFLMSFYLSHCRFVFLSNVLACSVYLVIMLFLVPLYILHTYTYFLATKKSFAEPNLGYVT